METTLYFTVKVACAIFVLCDLWRFIFNKQMYGIWDKIYNLMRIVRIKLWKYRKKRMKQKARNANKKAKRKKLVAKTDTPHNKPEVTASSIPPAADDDVIGKTKIVYLEDPEVARKTPTRSEPLKKEPIKEDEEISPEDVAQEDKGLTKEEKEELMAPVDAEPDPDFVQYLINCFLNREE